MPRPQSRITISIETQLLRWANKIVEKKIEYRDRNHLFEVALSWYRDYLEGMEETLR